MKKLIKKFLKNTFCVALSVFMSANFFVSVASAVEEHRSGYFTVAATEANMNSVAKNTPMNADLLTKSQKLYVKDVKFIVADNLEEAKKSVPAGYTMLEEDLNQGAEIISSVDEIQSVRIYFTFLEILQKVFTHICIIYIFVCKDTLYFLYMQFFI